MAKLFVALLPVLLAGYFAVVYTVAYRMFGTAALQHIRRLGAVVYAAFLLAVWMVLDRYVSLGSLWRVPGDGIMWAGIAVATGIGLFVFELRASVTLSRLASSKRSGSWWLMEGDSRATIEAEGRSWGFAARSIVIVVLEEMVYRGQVLTVLRSEVTRSAIIAVVITAGVFGLNHYWFGLRNVGLKSVDGVIWGWAVIASGSLLAPILSHLVFQACVWRRLAIQDIRATGVDGDHGAGGSQAGRPRSLHMRLRDVEMERAGE
jgi:membrane protease YdiL (CAAX protease family)